MDPRVREDDKLTVIPGHAEIHPLQVQAFVEKLNQATAEQYLQQGGYYWDAVWSVLPKDEDGNAHVVDVLHIDSRNTLVQRLANPGSIPLEIIEVQSGSYFGVHDIVRFEDTYGRSRCL